MSKVCDICGKKSIVATVRKKLRGKYNPTAKKRKYPNLRWVFISPELNLPRKFNQYKGKRIKICSRCLKSLYKTLKIKTEQK